MIIHIWMHWFWITTFFMQAFLLLSVQMISLSYIPQPSIAEAGLLNNENFTDHNLSFYSEINSSHIESNPNITSLPTVVHVDGLHPPEIISHRPQPPNLPEEAITETLEDVSSIISDSTSDVEDTYNGNSDIVQYPLKKFTKYSHIKYGKGKGKGKTSEESSGEERKEETVKIVEEKVNINISISGENAGRLGPEIDKLNDSVAEGNASEIPSEVGEVITTTVSLTTVDVPALNVSAVSDLPDDTSPLVSEEPPKPEGVTVVSSTAAPNTSEVSLRPMDLPLLKPAELPPNPTDFPPNPTEDQKDVLFKNDTLVIENKVEERTTVEPFMTKTRVAAATSAQNYEAEQAGMNAGSITGITLGILVVFSLFGAVSFVLYRRRYLNKPQVLHDKCSNLDSSGYIDDTSLRENSEEMYSLDNDSFLNSLEAMTIQNYWTESVKHTKL